VVCARLDVINLPKVESAAAVNEATAAIERVEKARGLTSPIKLLLNIETARATRMAHEIAAANKRVMGITIGFGDLFEPLGIDRMDHQATHQLLLSGRLAAAEAGVEAYDGAYANVADQTGFLAEAERSRRMGFAGKSCIHPSQVPLANEVYRPSDAEIAHALKVLEAAGAAEASATGAFMVDGHMVDGPFIARAENIAAMARRLGLLPAAG
jgi:citrate lyase subunit beta/citryl-CoA lyase